MRISDWSSDVCSSDLDGARQLEDFMQTATTITQTHSSIAQSPRAIAAATLLSGLGLVFLTGFAPAPAVHHAAHDPRHPMAFPCHCAPRPRVEPMPARTSAV